MTARRTKVSKVVEWLIAHRIAESLSDSEIKAAPRALRDANHERLSISGTDAYKARLEVLDRLVDQA